MSRICTKKCGNINYKGNIMASGGICRIVDVVDTFGCRRNTIG